ncbi:MAG: glyoxylate carboligase [Candidimonas sp.]|nr:MAG: glyoxylate carboligase [Candidimonas sp.]
MAKMRAVDAAAAVLEKEGIRTLFGVPGSAINPLYSALRKNGKFRHILARHVEGASHMAEGYTRAHPGNIGVCLGTSGPAGTDMLTGLYSAAGDSIPILCVTGQAPRAQLYKESFQAVAIEAVAAPVAKWAVTVREPELVPRVFQQAFHIMRSGRPGPVLIDLPIDVQLAEIEFDPDTYAPLPVYRPTATRAQAIRAIEMLNRAERPLIISGGGVFSSNAADKLRAFAELTGVPVVPTLMGWGVLPDDHPLMAGMVGLQTSHRYGNANFLASDFVMGIGNRWANRHTGSMKVYREGRTFVHIDVEPTQIGRVFGPDYGIVSDAGAALDLMIEVAGDLKKSGVLKERGQWAKACQTRKSEKSMQRKTHFDNVPLKPQRVYEEMNKFFDSKTHYVSTIGLSQIAAAQFLHVYQSRHWVNSGQAAPLGWSVPAALGVSAALPGKEIVAVSGDYDFQFLIEELAVGAQFKLPYIHIVVNNAYLGLIRQAQRNFDMDYCVQLSFDNINAPETNGYGVDHVAVAQGLGCKALRVHTPEQIPSALAQARAWIKEYSVPVVVEFILERITNISMGNEINAITEFEELAEKRADAPTALVSA